jgi:ribosomal protein S18 acetylase RimI-like enzyme
VSKLLVVSFRPLRAGDVPVMRRLLSSELGGTPYADAMLPVFELALEASSTESQVLVATAGDELVGFILYGLVAGASGAGRLHVVIVTAAARLSGIATRLVDAAAAELSGLGARMVIAELANDPMHAPGLALLRRSQFVEEAVIADYYREGVDQLILRREMK